MKAWLIGFANAAISCAATNLGGFVFGVDWKTSLKVSAFAFGISLIKWIAQHPIPGGTN